MTQHRYATDISFEQKEQRDTDAQLIAAAPDLLAALKELVTWWEIDGGNLDRSLANAIAAIAKAEGSAP